MKRIIFIRHAKAEELTPEKLDFERSLTLKGKEVSHLMSKYLRRNNESLGTIVSSPAFRAIETALIFAREFGADLSEVVLNSEIYDNFNEKALKKIFASTSDDSDIITLFGHNFSFTDLASALSKEGCEEIPKTGIVSLAFNVKSWEDIKPGTGKIEYFLKPKNIL